MRTDGQQMAASIYKHSVRRHFAARISISVWLRYIIKL